MNTQTLGTCDQKITALGSLVLCAPASSYQQMSKQPIAVLGLAAEGDLSKKKTRELCTGVAALVWPNHLAAGGIGAPRYHGERA